MFKSAKGAMGDPWLGGVIKKTIHPFGLVIVCAFAFGWIVQKNCHPSIVHLAEAIQSCEAGVGLSKTQM